MHNGSYFDFNNCGINCELIDRWYLDSKSCPLHPTKFFYILNLMRTIWVSISSVSIIDRQLDTNYWRRMDDPDEVDELHLTQVTFSHGDVIPETSKEFQCEVLSEIKNSNKIRKVLIADRNKRIYCGNLDKSQLTKNFLVVRNKETNTVRWFLVDNFLMLPHSSEQEKKVSPIKIDQETTREAMVNLNKAMGSKKIKRRLLEAERRSINLDNIEKTVEMAIKSNDIVVESIPQVLPSGENYLPPCNRNASSVENVYHVYDLISREILDSLEDISLEVLQKKLTVSSNDERLSPFFFKAYSQMTKPDSAKIKLLIFVDALLKFLKEPMKTIRLKDPVLCKFNSILNKKILDDFCTIGLGGVRNRPPSMRDKAICYMLVCLLLTYNFILDMSILSGFLIPQDYNKLPLFLKYIGATKDRGKATVFQLKLPLAELTVNAGQRRGGYKRKY